MEYTCDECYNLRQKSIEKCPLCGRNTFEGRVIGWSNCMMCTNCGMQVASAGGYPESCHTDDREYRIERLTEKQYNNIYMVTGEPDYQEKTVGVNCHIMII
ncbi:MAG: hypothetical protein Q4A15_04670 [Prevotellaceae bacterium]|nr:hypothetical protein [Prevotellaceae bacterium]